MTRTFMGIFKTNDAIAEEMGPSTAAVSICDTDSTLALCLAS